MRTQQPFLFKSKTFNLNTFGGSLLKGHPRHGRPISVKRPMHLVMRSSLAKGERSFLHPSRSRRIRYLVYQLARRSNLRVYRFANAGNHLHLIVRASSRISFRAYIRALTGLIARMVLKAERGRRALQKFWEARPFSRILEWGRNYAGACRYLLQNSLEALGFIAYTPRKSKSGRFRKEKLKRLLGSL